MQFLALHCTFLTKLWIHILYISFLLWFPLRLHQAHLQRRLWTVIANAWKDFAWKDNLDRLHLSALGDSGHLGLSSLVNGGSVCPHVHQITDLIRSSNGQSEDYQNLMQMYFWRHLTWPLYSGFSGVRLLAWATSQPFFRSSWFNLCKNQECTWMVLCNEPHWSDQIISGVAWY